MSEARKAFGFIGAVLILGLALLWFNYPPEDEDIVPALRPPTPPTSVTPPISMTANTRPKEPQSQPHRPSAFLANAATIRPLVAKCSSPSFPNSRLGTHRHETLFRGEVGTGNGVSNDCVPKREFGNEESGKLQQIQFVIPRREEKEAIGPIPRVLESASPPATGAEPDSPFYQTTMDPPLGYTGPSGILPRDVQRDPHFVPVEDRWRLGFPAWDRYDKGHPWNDDYPYVPGRWWDPYNQNVFKGDFPILGQHTFFEITGATQAFFEPRQVPTATTPFESTTNPHSEDFFGRPNQFFYSQNFFLSLDLFHGDAAFKPVDWRVKLTPAFNVNYLAVEELAVVSPNITDGTTRGRTFMTLQEWFAESKLADIGPDYDFISVRAGAQPFVSDFRGFIFSDTNRAVRLFGTNFSERHQFNLVYFQQLEKDTNSFLNSFHDRHQGVLIGNYYIQDFIFPGYTTEFSVHYNHDSPTFKYDNNGFLVRPEPVGSFQTHTLDVAYLGWAGDGHINRFNINHAFYLALGHDTLNPLSNTPQDIDAQMAAIELSYDQDWIRFRTSFFWASGDNNVRDHHATGFDSIIDNPNFAGGEFSYWQRQQIGLLGANLVQRMSLLPSLRSNSQASKFQAQANFVNPGLYLGNVGADFELTPKFRLIHNVNFLWFDSVQPLQQFVFQQTIKHSIGTDISLGAEYRPFLNNNMLFIFGVSTLIPGAGFRTIFNSFDHNADALVAGFLEAVLTF